MLQLEWNAVQQQLQAAKQAAIDARKEQALVRSGGGGGGGGSGSAAENEDNSRAVLRKGKAQFAPATAGEGPSSSGGKLKKAVSKRASLTAAAF